MKTWDDTIKRALGIYIHRDEYAYFYGAKNGIILTDQVMNQLIDEEPAFFSKYSPSQIRQFKEYSRNKRGFDCSGFVSYISGVSGWSGSLWQMAYDKDENIYNGTAASLLFLPGHVGWDIGYGYSLSFDSMGGTCNLRRHIEDTIHWTGCGKLPGVNYDGADNR